MRRKKSKFDPYLNEITEYAAAGMTVLGIAERIQKYFEDYVEESAVYAFMRSREYSHESHKAEQILTIKPQDVDCDNCITVINTTGKDVLLCGG